MKLEKEIFIMREGVLSGPYDERAALLSAGLQQDTPVWYEGLEDWTPAFFAPLTRPLFFETAPGPSEDAAGDDAPAPEPEDKEDAPDDMPQLPPGLPGATPDLPEGEPPALPEGGIPELPEGEAPVPPPIPAEPVAPRQPEATRRGLSPRGRRAKTQAPPRGAEPPQTPPENAPKSYLVWAILSCVLCCMPTGVVAILMTVRTRRFVARGQMDKAAKASEQAQWWIIISIVLGLVWSVMSVPFNMLFQNFLNWMW